MMKKTIIVLAFLIIFFPSTAAFGHGTGIESEDEKNLFREYFFSQDGQLVLDIEPSNGDQIKVTGEQQYAHNAYVMPGSTYSPDVSNQVLTSSTPIQITGPAFDSDGIYTFNIELRTIDNPDEWIWSLSDMISEVSVTETTYHNEKNLDGINTEFRIKSYYDSITSFDYDANKKLATIVMPFDWSEKNISHVDVVHEEIMFPKDFVEFLSPSYVGQANGIDLFKSSVVIDDYTEEEDRIVHFILLNDHVKFLKNQMKKELETLPDSITFTLTTSNEAKFPLEAMTRDEQYKVDLSWEPEVILPDEKTKFIYTLRDSTGNPIRNSGYDLVIIQNGSEILRTSETTSIGGGFFEYTWVRNNAAWWADGEIDDRTFANGIEFMIKEGIIVVPVTESGETKEDVAIPDWVRNNAAWWSEGQIDDKTFANGLQFLIKEGIISV